MSERLVHSLLPADKRGRGILLAILLVALVLRLAVWQWHLLYPLGGDEQEYFNQALTWLRGAGYHDLPLMRPPLYPVFLAAVFRLFDSQVQRVRLVQALISTGSVYLQWLMARAALVDRGIGERAALTAAALAGCSFTLAANATELLTETIFVFELTAVFCLVLWAGRRKVRQWQPAALAGALTGLLALLRSVALPLLPIAGLWLLLGGRAELRRPSRGAVTASLVLIAAGAGIIAPWTARNYFTYGQPIVVDTTGAENLWLDNDPAGREAVKRMLYALGEERGKRQSLALERGLRAIGSDPLRFAGKAFGEAKKLVALEYWDDMRNRPAIWVPPAEVWLRLLLGDGIWLLLTVVGGAGLWLLDDRRLRLLFIPWVLYVAGTSLLFHVELRYRLPLYPVLAVAAAPLLPAPARRPRSARPWRLAGAGATTVALIALMLLRRPYLQEGVMLARKHWDLWQGDGRLALRLDPDSALARVQMAAPLLRDCAEQPDRCTQAEALLREAIRRKPAHAYPHLLLGGLLRRRQAVEAARQELRFETASLEDLQQWMVHRFGPRGEQRLDLGDGLDLGDIEGFYPAADGYRWTTGKATIWLRQPRARGVLRLRLAAGHPGGKPVPVQIHLGSVDLGSFVVRSGWQTLEVPVPAQDRETARTAVAAPVVALTIEVPTFRPRDFDRASPDNRDLGLEIDWVELFDAETT